MVKLFTHTDLDGVGCAVLAKIAFDTNVDIEYCNYDEINNKINDFIYTELESEDMCHITDISITDEIAKDIDENSNQFYLLDHHPTALDLNKYNWCTVKIEDELTHIKTSGTELYYKWLVDAGYIKESDTLMRFVELVRNYDTWRWSTLGEEGVICKQINDLLYLYGRDCFIDFCVSEINTCVFPKLYKADEFVLKIKQQEIDNYIDKKDKTIFTTTLCGYTCGFVFAERFFSELGNKLCLRHPELDFVAMVDMDGTVSYRSVKDNIDVGKDIAKIYGGGGHPKTAGSQFSNDVRLKTLENIFV